jgi:allophanate hydrolase subunit 1
LDRGDICFGGPNGLESVGLPVSFLDSGSYYGFVLIIDRDECIVRNFRARQVLAINAYVVSIYGPKLGSGTRGANGGWRSVVDLGQ